MFEHVRMLRVGVDDWLVVDAAFNVRYLIHYGPAVNQVTHDTVMMYQVINSRGKGLGTSTSFQAALPGKPT